MKNLVIVESPTKSKTIEKYLGSDFRVLATVGHFRDLSEKNGIDVDNDFALNYAVDQDKVKILKEITGAVADCDSLLLATDPDREGEAIAWHLHEYLLQKGALPASKTVRRVVFHEITQRAVEAAFQEPRKIDQNLVDAYQARRALDRLFGFEISTVLRHKLPGTRSGGRVQSPSLRLICEREEEIENFVPQEYWTVDTSLKTEKGQTLKAQLTHLNGTKLTKFSLKNKLETEAAVSLVRNGTYHVMSLKRRQVQKRPYPPFRTSTLQQAASRLLGMSARQCAGVAQELFREGLITYMRTDSISLSSDAVQSIRSAIKTNETLGPKYLPDGPRHYKNKTKNAQEAHEAIRPTNIELTPKDLPQRLDRATTRLYELIWKRTIASQMENGVDNQLAIDVSSSDETTILHSSGSTVAFDGFRKIYAEEKKDGQSDSKPDSYLPNLEEGDPLELEETTLEQHHTKPPSRYNEASLIGKLEELGIGRPSTYPEIVRRLEDRKYVSIENRQLFPQGIGRGVTILLETHFSNYVDYEFTAGLENKLDDISNGKRDYVAVLRDFYVNFNPKCDYVGNLSNREVLNSMNEHAGKRFFPLDDNGSVIEKCPKCEEGELSLKWSNKSGPFIGCTKFDETKCKYTLAFSKIDRDGLEGPRELGQNEEGKIISLRRGRYGLYIQLGEVENGQKPKTVSLPSNLSPANLGMDTALALLALPREIGAHPETGETITVTVGSKGAYIRHGERTRSLTKDDDVMTIGINRAVSLLAEPRRRQRSERKPVRVIATHPDDGKDVVIYDGQWGLYINHKSVNVSLPKSMSAEDITPEQAVSLLAEKAKSKKKGGRRTTATRKRTSRKSPKKKS